MDEKESMAMNRLNPDESLVLDTAEEQESAVSAPGRFKQLWETRRIRIGAIAILAVSAALAMTAVVAGVSKRGDTQSTELVSEDGSIDLAVMSNDVVGTGTLYDMTSVYSGASSETDIVATMLGGSKLLIYDVYGSYYKISNPEQTIKGFVLVDAVNTAGIEIKPRNGYKGYTPIAEVADTGSTTPTQKKSAKKTKIALKNLSFDFDEITIEKGKSVSVNAIFTPADATLTQCIWRSDNTDIAWVQSANDGKSCVVTAGKVGRVQITAVSEDGKLSASFTVIVKAPAVKGLSFDVSEKNVKAGDKFKVTLRLDPTDAAANDIVWSSSNTSVARFGNNSSSYTGGAEVQIYAIGGDADTSCVITASTKDKKYSAQFTLYVKATVVSEPVSSDPTEPTEPTESTEPTDNTTPTTETSTPASETSQTDGTTEHDGGE